MFRSILLISLTFSISFQAQTASAQDRNISLAGVGARSCQTLNERAITGRGWDQNEYTLSIMSWAQGFISGVNIFKLQAERMYFDLASVTVDQQWTHIVAFCRAKSGMDIGHAVSHLIANRLIVRQCRDCDPTRPLKRKQ